MKISIIIASRNRKKFLIDLLNDINLQKHDIDEVVISDQSETFEEIKQTYNFKLLHFQHFGIGPCISRNDAVKKASGDIIVFLDDDARIDADFIDEITQPIRNEITVACSGAICNEEGEYKFNEPDYAIFSNKLHWIVSFTKNPNHPGEHFCQSAPAGCFAIKKSVFDELGGYDVTFDPNGAGEDRDMALNLISHGYSIYYNGRAKLIHLAEKSGGRRSSDNENTSRSFKKNMGYIILKYLGKSEFNNYLRSEIRNRCKEVFKFNSPIYNLNELFVFFKLMREVRAYNTFNKK